MTEGLDARAEKSRKTKKTIFALVLGGIVGFLGAMAVLKLGDAGVLGALDPSREIAALVGMLYFVTGAFVGFGLIAPGAGAKFLNVEDADELREQKAMLGYSALGMVAMGLALFVAAMAAPAGPIAPGVALAIFGVLAVIGVWVSITSMKYQDELMRAVGREGAGTAFYLTGLVGGTWALLAHLGYASAPAPLDWLTMLWSLLLLAAFIVVGRRGMMEMR
ncbi:MAG: hypothetical protein WBA68_08145 [Alteraurantiacibacter sp.]